MLTAMCVSLDLKWPLFLLYFNQGWYCPRTYSKSLPCAKSKWWSSVYYTVCDKFVVMFWGNVVPPSTGWLNLVQMVGKVTRRRRTRCIDSVGNGQSEFCIFVSFLYNVYFISTQSFWHPSQPNSAKQNLKWMHNLEALSAHPTSFHLRNYDMYSGWLFMEVWSR